MKKEEAKKFIEDTLNDYLSANLGGEDSLYPFFTATERSIHGRTAYEMLKRFEKGQDICKNYDFGRDESLREGIPLSLVKISKNIWVPENYKKKLFSYENPFFKSFELFETDEYNAFMQTYSKEKQDLIKRVLYCEDENRGVIGKKLNLFLENPAWREDAKRYSRLLLETLNSNYKNNEFLKLYNDSTSERAKQGFKAIDLITSLYLDEMK